MNYSMFSYKGDSRELKKIITAILKSGLSDHIKKINYVQNFCLNEKKIEKIQEKVLLIHTDDYDKLINFLSKNFPQMVEVKLD